MNPEDELKALLFEKLVDAQTPGVCVECSPEEASLAGAFHEEALSEEEAWQSQIDLLEAYHD